MDDGFWKMEKLFIFLFPKNERMHRMQNRKEERFGEKKFLSDIIGEKYLNWIIRFKLVSPATKKIFITTPTGSGKSYFILHVFLKQVIHQKKRMLYLVNRKILKEQIENELNYEIERELHKKIGNQLGSLKEWITVMTYQSIETGLKKDLKKTISILSNFDILVCDECHYFYVDSNFNTNTELSFDCLQFCFRGKLQIFLSATMNTMKSYIERYSVPPYASLLDLHEKKEPVQNNQELHEFYEGEADYGYIQLNVFDNNAVLISRIEESVEKDEKWLIFVDSIDAGKRLQKEIQNKNNTLSKEVVFIDASYQKDEETYNQVQFIAENQFSNKKILISTAVMDNGITLKDQELRNLVILADNQETFLQMIGRKRKDDKVTTVYICKRDVSHFKRRRQEVRKVLEFYDKYEPDLKKSLIRYFPENKVFEVKLFYDILYMNWMNNKMKNQSSKEKSYNKENQLWMREGYVECWLRSLEQIRCFQKNFLDDIFSNDTLYKKAKKLCYFVNGVASFNSFSIARYRDLDCFYADMIKRMELDENAFIKEQASWLGKTEAECMDCILKSKEEEKKRYRKILVDSLEEIIGQEMTEEENREWKMKCKDCLSFFYKETKGFSQSQLQGISKNDRPISSRIFNICMEQAEVPYRMRGRGRYIIQRIDRCKK